jgi:hypothetical protein|tara:strand:+ start:1516 stop:1755 length:240 start_codon:yes stop_codon:yes gene_type:complete
MTETVDETYEMVKKRKPKVYYYAYEDVDEALDRYNTFKKETTDISALVNSNYEFEGRLFKDGDGIYTIEVKVWKKLLKE